MVTQFRSRMTVRSRLALVCAAAGLCILSLWVLAAGAAGASTAQDQPKLTPGAVFTSTNTVPNRVLAYNRDASGQLTLVQDIQTGGNGKPAGNPPFTGFPVLDSMGSVNLSDDGDGKPCLFVVNAGSNSVSSFRVGPDGLELADQKPSGGSRPASLTSNSRGGSKQVLYVLNSDNTTASFRGFNVSRSCVLTQIQGSDRLLPSQASVPATIRFDERGRHLAVSERFAPAQPAGNGDIVVYPVDSNGLTGAPVVTPSPERTPYGLDYNHHDILSVTNELSMHRPSRTPRSRRTGSWTTGRSFISTPSPRRVQRAGTCSRTTASSCSSPIRPASSCRAAPTCCLSPSTTTAR